MNNFSVDFKDTMLNRMEVMLYGQEEQYITERFITIFRKNAYDAFAYKNQTYGRLGVMQFFSHPDVLHKSLEEEMDEILEEEAEFQKEKYAVLAYIRRALNIGSSLEDFKELLPKVLFEIFMGVYKNRYILESQKITTLSPVEIARFKSQNGQYKNLAKERLITNLLLKRLR